jgi:hypothetical protein
LANHFISWVFLSFYVEGCGTLSILESFLMKLGRWGRGYRQGWLGMLFVIRK